MQLLMPSLTLVLVAVAIAFFLLPQLAPAVLVTGGAAVMVLAMYSNWSQFSRSEYEQATWMYNLRKYSSYVIIGVILLGAYGFYAMNQTSAAPATPLPAIMAPTVGGGLRSMMDTASSRINELMRKGRITLD